jgi:uncharacterized membrane protein YfcA
MDIAAAIAIGFAAGVVSGMLGVGGGVLFVPALALLLGLSHLEAEATSLLAMIPVALVGAWRQQRYGNLRLRDGVLVGVLALGGALGGVVLANVVPERALEVGFAILMLLIAGRLARRALRRGGDRGSPPGRSARATATAPPPPPRG